MSGFDWNTLVNWSALGQVFAAAVGGAIVIVGLFALGVRFLTDAQALTPDALQGKPRSEGKEAAYRALAYVCFVLAALGVAYEIYLLVKPLVTPAS